MAQRFGGRFSPPGNRSSEEDGPSGLAPTTGGFKGKRPGRAGGRVNLLFFAPFVFAFQAFGGDPADLAFNLTAFGLLIASAFLTREGVLAHDAYDARRVARRPAFPRKIVASVVTGAALFVGGLAGDPSFVNSTIFAVAGFLLHFFAFGPDPMRDKGTEGLDRFQTDRVARAVDEAEGYLAGMKDAILRTGDRALEGRVERFAATARALFRAVEADPRDLTAARKDIGVFLMGTRDATVKFADLYAENRSARARTDYEQLLTDLERHFRTRIDALQSNDHADLDIEIEVLRERLALEGPRRTPDPLFDASRVAEPSPRTNKGD